MLKKINELWRGISSTLGVSGQKKKKFYKNWIKQFNNSLWTFEPASENLEIL